MSIDLLYINALYYNIQYIQVVFILFISVPITIFRRFKIDIADVCLYSLNFKRRLYLLFNLSLRTFSSICSFIFCFRCEHNLFLFIPSLSQFFQSSPVTRVLSFIYGTGILNLHHCGVISTQIMTIDVPCSTRTAHCRH